MRMILVLLLSIVPALAQSSVPSNSNEIHQLFLEDQSDRGPTGNTGPSDQIALRDAKRLARAKELLQSGALVSGDDFHDAAFIFQHSLKPDDYLMAHVLATAAIAKGDKRSLWIAAASLDRYLQSTGKPQIFGTQYASKSFFYFTQHPVNPDLNNPDAKDTTISQEPYDSSRISDSVRRTFCVVDLDTQKKNVAALNEHKPLVRRPQGCPEE